jgi:uncharacterized membrane-anchored protein
MPDRLTAETERLRKAIRTRAWKHALAICASMTQLLVELDADSATRAQRRPTARAIAPAVVDGVRLDATRPVSADLVPLTELAHEASLDRRTVERRLERRGCPIQRWGRIALVNRADGLAAVRSFERATG